MNRVAQFSITVLIIAGLLPPLPPVAAQGISGPPGLQALIQDAWKTNKELAALKKRINATGQKARAAGSLDDPRLGFALLNIPTDTFDFGQEAMTQKQISLSQRFLWFGRLDLQSRVLVLESARLEAEYEARKLALARQVAGAYWKLAVFERSLQVNQRLQDLVKQLLRVSETRYATGKGLQQDVLQGQVELSRLMDEKLVLEKQKQVAESRINELINRPAYVPVIPQTGSDFAFLEGLERLDLRREILRGNPFLKARLLAIQKAKAATELANKDYYPNFDLSLAYGQRDDEPGGRDRADFMSVAVRFNIPLWQKSRQDRNLEAARLELEAARKRFAGLADGLPHRALAVVQEIGSLHENIKLYRKALIFQARQWAEAAMAAYEVGKIEFRTLLEAHIRVLRLELQADVYRFSLLDKQAELEEILGVRLDKRRNPDPADAKRQVFAAAAHGEGEK